MEAEKACDFHKVETTSQYLLTGEERTVLTVCICQCEGKSFLSELSILSQLYSSDMDV